MADHHHNPGWLRNLARSRSSTPTGPPSLSSFHPHLLSAPSPTTDSPPRHRKSTSSTIKNVSSFLNLKSRSYGAAVAEEETHMGPRMPAPLAMLPLTDVEWDVPRTTRRGRSPRRRNTGDSVADATREKATPWYNPTVMQMAETLTAALGGGRAQDGLPVAYNSCVLALVEGFYRLTAKLRDTDEELAELKVLRELELEQFRSMTEEWLETSEGYKKEVKRLELALAKESKDGIASVALARHGSLVDRAGSKRFHVELQKLHGKQTQDARPRILDKDNDVLVSRIVEQREAEERRFHQQQQQQQGRVRAGPVVVRRGSLSPEKANGGFCTTFMDRDIYNEMKQEQAVEESSFSTCATPKVKPRFELPSDGDSTSSESGASTETGDEMLGPGKVKLFDPLKGAGVERGMAQALGDGDGTAAGKSDGLGDGSEAAQPLGSDGASEMPEIAHSTSTGTVKYVGNGKGKGKGKVKGKPKKVDGAE
ncbi:hypothetical protein N0V88_001118 [Collariella sp. IMI 366227]|nr:hypothetical protein N0V88_001118 [Collariella sp. IMI 366227]